MLLVTSKGGIKTKMKKLWKGKKALSPVVAAIILIAVTVAVSIAVAAWMGALTFTFMATEQLDVQGAQFNGESGISTNNTIVVTAENTGTTDLTVDKYKLGVGGTQRDITDVDIAQGQSADVTLTTGAHGETWTSGTTYDIYLITSSGKQFPYRATAP
jgi:flagellin-like protein